MFQWPGSLDMLKCVLHLAFQEAAFVSERVLVEKGASCQNVDFHVFYALQTTLLVCDDFLNKISICSQGWP